MLKKAILGWNAAPGAPKGRDPAVNGECGALPIRVHPPASLKGDARVEYCESAWEPTPQELEYLNRGGQVVLHIVGWQPPVSLYVEQPSQEAQAEDAELESALVQKLNQCRVLLAHALNAMNGVEFFRRPPDPKEWADTLTKAAIEGEFVVFDDLHHAPACPANHFHKTRMPTGRCRCGAQSEADRQAKQA